MSVSVYKTILDKTCSVRQNQMTYIKDIIDEELKNSNCILHIDNGEETFSPKSVKGMVGNKNWTVVYHGDQRLQDIEDALKQLKTENIQTKNDYNQIKTENSQIKTENRTLIARLDRQDKFLKDLGYSKIKNLVCQMLLFLEGSQPNYKKSGRFHHLQGDREQRIKLFVQEINMNMKNFIKKADSLIEKRNVDVHSRDIETLDERVIQAQDWLKEFPEWKNSAIQFECLMLDNWSVIKQYLPQNKDDL